MARKFVGTMRLNWVRSILARGYLMSRNDQQPTCRNAVCGNLRLTIKYSSSGVPNEEKADKNAISSTI